MDRYTIVSELAKEFSDSKVRIGLKIPDVTEENIAINRKRCAEDICHNYDKSCTCPPRCGSESYCIERIKSYNNADMFIRSFDVDVKDEKKVNIILGKFQKDCRKIMIGCKEAGFDVLVLADGPCNYCERCAALNDKECIHPEMQIPSVSGYGIDMEKYLKYIGETFEFRNDRITLYGLFLFR